MVVLTRRAGTVVDVTSPQPHGPYPRRAYVGPSSFGPRWGHTHPGTPVAPRHAAPQPQYHRRPGPAWGHYGTPPAQTPYPAPPGYQPWQQPPRRRSGSAWWLALPIVVVALMVGYFSLTRGALVVQEVAGEDVAYVNEDYAVPASGEGPTQIVDTRDNPSVLTDSPFYDQPVPVPVRCEPADVTNLSDAAELQRRSSDMSECLTKTFGPALEASGFEAYQPRVLVYSTEGTTPCGELELPGAFYCGANQGIYLSADVAKLGGRNLAGVDYVLAHEYAHNVQGRTGILIQRVYEQRKATDEARELEVSRRLETQADCLAASFVNSVSESLGYTDRERGLIVDAARSVGDDMFLPPEELPSTHGVSASRELWTERGFSATRFGDCNTFIAPADEVR